MQHVRTQHQSTGICSSGLSAPAASCFSPLVSIIVAVAIVAIVIVVDILATEIVVAVKVLLVSTTLLSIASLACVAVIIAAASVELRTIAVVMTGVTKLRTLCCILTIIAVSVALSARPVRTCFRASMACALPFTDYRILRSLLLTAVIEVELIRSSSARDMGRSVRINVATDYRVALPVSFTIMVLLL